MTDEELIARLRDVCTCNIDSTPCMAEDDCRDALAAADRIETLKADLKSVLDRESATYARHDAKVERLEAALHNCVGMLDQLVVESGRAIEWNAEDPFRMGEWFEPEDLAQIEQARAALKGDDHD